MAEKVITRQMHCERCEKAGRPYRDNQLVVCGENGFHVRTVERYVPPEDKGFTPHLLELYKVLDDKNVAIVRVCCVVGCGLNIADDPQDRNKSIFTYSKVSYDQITLADYNAIVMCKNFGYYL